MTPRRPLALASLLSKAVLNQAMLSLASFAVGIILVRHTADLQYGYYILGWNAILLLISLQNAFFGQPLALRLQRMDRAGRGDVVGGLYRAQRQILSVFAYVTTAISLTLWSVGVLNSKTGPLALAVIAASLAVLNREYFRIVLLAYRRPQDVLRGDSVYVVVLVSAAAIATLNDASATVAIIGLGIAAAIGAVLLSRQLRLFEPWNIRGAQGLLRDISPLGSWFCAGAAIHWSFSQGYSYLVAGTLGVDAVAAIAATRLLMMPINLMSVGITSLMLPLAAQWLADYGAHFLLRRLSLFAAILATAALFYFGVLWLLRGWIFSVILKKHFVQQDQLVTLWFCAFLIMIIRDQLIYLLVVRSRYRVLTALALLSAALSLTASYMGMRLIGEAGAPLGVLIGELMSVLGITMLSRREPDQYPVFGSTAGSNVDTVKVSVSAG